MADSVLPFDDRDGFIWYDGRLVPWRDAKLHVLTHGLHYASCVFEGERVYNGKVFRMEDHNERLINSAKILGFEVPASMDDLARATLEVVAGQQDRRRLCAADRLARRRADGRLGAGQQNPPGARLLGLAGLFLAGGARQGHPHDLVALGPSGAEHRADPGQGVGPLHDLHDGQARGRGAGLRRRADARLARPARRGHRRQYLPRDQRRIAHADAGLLPQRHHPPDRDGAGAKPRHQGRRAGDHARGAGERRRGVPDRLGRRGHAGRRDRRPVRPLPLHAGHGSAG